MTKIYKIRSKKIEVDKENKIFFPQAKISKKDLIDYYQKIYPQMKTHLNNRAISMERCPDGIDKKCFYHKQVPDYFPDWIETTKLRVKEEKSYQKQVIINNKATLIYLADQGMITPHTWLSKKDDNYKPDKIIFDLDPPPSKRQGRHPKNPFDLVRFGAQKLKEEFERRDLQSFVMTTGSKGLHIIIPIKPEHRFKKIREYSKKIANNLAKKYPQKLTTETLKKKRKGRLFLDYLRNSYGQTTVCPYAVRTIKEAPIAAPIRWDETSEPDLTSQKYTVKNIFKRTSHIKNPWPGYEKVKNKIEL